MSSTHWLNDPFHKLIAPWRARLSLNNNLNFEWYKSSGHYTEHKSSGLLLWYLYDAFRHCILTKQRFCVYLLCSREQKITACRFGMAKDWVNNEIFWWTVSISTEHSALIYNRFILKHHLSDPKREYKVCKTSTFWEHGWFT